MSEPASARLTGLAAPGRPASAPAGPQSPAASVIGYACALDARDWPAFRALFGDRIVLDYGAIGSIVGTIDADDWVQRCRLLEGFDATLHRLSNLRVEGDDAGTVARSYVDALHFIAVDGETHIAHLVGAYTHGLRRDAAGVWRIASCRLDVAGYPAGQPQFAHAFALARARFAGRA